MSVLKTGSKGPEVAKLQNLLNSNLKPIPLLDVDGDFGAATRDAVIRYQKTQGLKADGIVGEKTWRSLGQQNPPPKPKPTTPTPGTTNWMAIAAAELGVHEDALAGKHNQRIIEYHATTTLKATTDETPWCSSFVNWVMTQAGYTGTNNALAKSWLNWGTALTTPREGAITVIKKKTAGSDSATGTATGFHVGFYAGGTTSTVRLLGGNQSDRVKYSNFSLQGYDVKGYRWPS